MELSQIDGLILLILALAFIIGFLKGFLGQFFGLLAIILAFFVSKHFGTTLSEWFELNLGLHPAISIILSFGLIWGIILAIISFFSHIFRKLIEHKFSIKIINSLLGGFLVLIESVLIICFALYVHNILPNEYMRNCPYVAEKIQQSKILREFQLNNPLMKISYFKSFYLYIQSNRNIDISESELLKNPKIKKLLDNDEIAEIVRNKNFIQFINHPLVKELIDDDDFQFYLDSQLENIFKIPSRKNSDSEQII